MYKIPMKCEDHRKDFITQIDWPHFHAWMKNPTGAKHNDNVRSLQPCVADNVVDHHVNNCVQRI